MRGAAVRVVLLGCVYFAAGIVFATLAGRAVSLDGRIAWRWTAWIVSVLAFGAHIVFEQLRPGSAPRLTALRVSLAAGLGAFGLAAAANVHAQLATDREHSVILLASLVIWPVIIGLPAFVVALVSASVLARLGRKRGHARS